MKYHAHQPPQKGVTLLELLIAVTIVGILATLAVPGYGAVLRRAQRNEARLALLRIQHAEERFYQRHLRYTEQMGAGGLGLDARSEGRSYQLSVALEEEGQAYLAAARVTRDGRQARDMECAVMTLDHTGRRAAASAGGDDTSGACWR